MNDPDELDNNVTSDIQLNTWGSKHIPKFRGTIDQSQFDNVYKQMKMGESVIINLDPKYKHGGTHWVAVRLSSEAPLVYYKDSFGGPPPTEIIKAIGNSIPGRGLVYGNRITQKMDEENCGKRAAHFLAEMAGAAKKGVEIEYFEQMETE